MGLGLCVTLGSGCLVTDSISFDPEPDEPPAILDSPTSKLQIGRSYWVDKTAATMWQMQVVIREKNINRALRAHFRIVDPEIDLSQQQPPMFTAVAVPAGRIDDPTLRDLTFEVQTDPLTPSHCHRLELAVSGSFLDRGGIHDLNDPSLFTVVTEPGDIDTAVWGIWEGDRDRITDPEGLALLKSCNAEVVLAPQANEVKK